MKLYFAGTPDFAAVALEALLQRPEYEIVGVFTQPDRPAGRGQKLQASPVKQLALQHGLAVHQPEKLKDATLLEALPAADLMVVAAYGLLLPSWFLAFPRLGCLNIHASLLPRWRGAAPIQRAIEAGDAETGIGIMQMEQGLDTGAVWLEKRLSIGEDDALQLQNRLAQLGAAALLEALPLVFSGQAQPRPQQGEALYAHKIQKEEALLDWRRDALALQRQVRALVAYPGAQTPWQGQFMKILAAAALPEAEHRAEPGRVIKHDGQGLDVACGRGVLRVQRLQLPGKRALPAAELRHGLNLQGMRLC